MLEPDERPELREDLVAVTKRARSERRPETVPRPVGVKAESPGDNAARIVAGAQVAHGNPIGRTNPVDVRHALCRVHAYRR